MLSGFKSQRIDFRIVLGLLPLAWLWFVLIGNVGIEWTLNPQYSYGWAVPFLCLYLLGQSARRNAEGGRQKAENQKQFWLPAFSYQLLFGLLAGLYLPTRLIQEANPDWRLVSWALALEVTGITLCLLRIMLGSAGFQVSGFRFQASTFVFPLLFFLVAVPWPTLVEFPLIQTLTRLDVSATCELAGWLGIPAVPHGNVIEVATGDVGIDEACSGIRSFQATLMISLFLGEFYALGTGRRVFCVAAGFLLSLLLNLARLTVLTWVAAHKGIPAIAGWHDPTGVIILLGCFCGLWGIGAWLGRKRPKAKAKSPKSGESGNQQTEARSSEIPACRLPFSVLMLTGWLVLVEVGVEGWYRYHEARLPAPVEWQVAWPVNNTTFKDLELAPETRRLLRFSDARYAGWQEDGLGWQVIYLYWKPGAIAQHMAGEHTPQTCLGAAGHKFIGGKELQYLTVQGMKLPFRFYQLTDTPQPVFEAYCLWDDRASTRVFEATSVTYAWRLPPVLAGQRNPGQRVIELAVTGLPDQASAQVAFQKMLEKIISPVH
ncbi:MAG: exosortase/archaeosortase family protein [Verrucomicrobiota bacterium]